MADYEIPEQLAARVVIFKQGGKYMFQLDCDGIKKGSLFPNRLEAVCDMISVSLCNIAFEKFDSED